MNLAPPKIVVQNEANISYIHCSERTVETWVGRHCEWLLGPLWADSAKILSGKRARVWQQVIGILLMSVDVLGRNGWKTVKNCKNGRFLMVFQPLRPHMSTHINEISIICCHILARLPHKILAESAHRGPSNRPQCWPTVGQPGFQQFARYSEYMKYWFHFEPWFLGCQIHETSSIMHQKKPKTLGYHHVKGYQDPST